MVSQSKKLGGKNEQNIHPPLQNDCFFYIFCQRNSTNSRFNLNIYICNGTIGLLNIRIISQILTKHLQYR